MSVETTNIGSIAPAREIGMSTQLSHHISIPAPTEMGNPMQTLYSASRDSKNGFSFSEDTATEPDTIQTENTNALTDSNYVNLYKIETPAPPVMSVMENEFLTPDVQLPIHTPEINTISIEQSIGENTKTELQHIRQNLMEKIEEKKAITDEKPEVKYQADMPISSPWLDLQKNYSFQKKMEQAKIVTAIPEANEAKNVYVTKLEERIAKIDHLNTQDETMTETKIAELNLTQDPYFEDLEKESSNLQEEARHSITEEEKIIAERDNKTDRARIALAVKIGQKLLEESIKNGGEGIDASEIAELMPARPGELMSRIRRQLRLPDDSEAQYDEFKTRLAKAGIVRSIFDITVAASSATDHAPAVQLNKTLTTEQVSTTDQERAISTGNDNLSFATI